MLVVPRLSYLSCLVNLLLCIGIFSLNACDPLILQLYRVNMLSWGTLSLNFEVLSIVISPLIDISSCSHYNNHVHIYKFYNFYHWILNNLLSPTSPIFTCSAYILNNPYTFLIFTTIAWIVLPAYLYTYVQFSSLSQKHCTYG